MREVLCEERRHDMEVDRSRLLWAHRGIHGDDTLERRTTSP
jgi:hypothetical protein